MPSTLRLLAAALLAAGASAADSVAVVVNATLQPDIQANLDTYVADLKAEGYAVTVKTWDKSQADQDTPQELKAWLAAQPGLTGAVFIGDLPLANVNSAKDTYQKNFVSDVYFMDLDTAWTYDSASGRFIQPPTNDLEIWVSRLKASNMPAFTGCNQAELINRYLGKNHRFRTGDLRLKSSGLVWATADWGSTSLGAVRFAGNAGTTTLPGYAYAGADCVQATELGGTRDKADWIAYTGKVFESEFFMAHSNGSFHALANGGKVTAVDIVAHEAKRLFYVNWNCSGGAYTVKDCVGNARMFTPNYGLVSVATTKTGSLLPLGFWNHLATGKTFGQSFIAYWDVSFGYITKPQGLSWVAGLVLLGDGTLKLGSKHPKLDPGKPPTNAKPTVAITAPAAGSTLITGSTVTISANAADSDGSVAKVEFFAGATPLGVDSSAPFSVTWTPQAAGVVTLTAIATDNKGAKTTSAGIAVTRVAPVAKVRPADQVGSTATGLDYAAYLGEWMKLPSFAGLTPVKTGVALTVSVVPRPRDDQFGLTFHGYLDVPDAGVWTLSLTSDDGARLWIGDALVVDNDGQHAPIEKSGAIALAKGLHRVTVAYFEGAQSQTLALAWQGPGVAKQAVPAAACRRLDLRPADTPAMVEPGVAYSAYLGSWSKLPAFASLKPVDIGIATVPGVGVRPREDEFGLRFTGFIDVPVAGMWTFALYADDGARLRIGDATVVDHDGLHGASEKTGAIGLKPGRHAFTLDYFEKTISQALELRWSGPDTPKATVPAKAFSHEPPGVAN